MNPEETAWLAGLLEGEGSFFLLRNRVSGKVYLYPQVIVGMTDRDVIERAAVMMESSVASVSNGQGRKRIYRAHAVGRKAVRIMRLIRPHMGLRRGKKIDDLLADWDARPTANQSRSEAMRQFVIVRGRAQGWHIFADYRLTFRKETC